MNKGSKYYNYNAKKLLEISNAKKFQDNII